MARNVVAELATEVSAIYLLIEGLSDALLEKSDETRDREEAESLEAAAMALDEEGEPTVVPSLARLQVCYAGAEEPPLWKTWARRGQLTRRLAACISALGDVPGEPAEQLAARLQTTLDTLSSIEIVR